MIEQPATASGGHNHVFLGAAHEANERKTWMVIALCTVMMAIEIVCGTLFGSLALVADGLHMSTHAAAMLIAALAYTYARRHARDPRFAFGTGKLGDLAGFSSAIILAMIALLIGYEAVSRLFSPVPINFDEALPIAGLGLLVNIASAWILSGDHDGHAHGHSHGHSHGHAHGAEDHHGHDHAEEKQRINTGHGVLTLEIHEHGVPPRFRVAFEAGQNLAINAVTLETERPDGSSQQFAMQDRGAFFESIDEIPEPHEFKANLRLVDAAHSHLFTVPFSEHAHASHDDHEPSNAHRDNNMRAAFVHVLADAAVSVLAIAGLLLGKYLGWTFMDPVMGIVGTLVIANWSYGLVRDTGGILLDMTPDQGLAKNIRSVIEAEGDHLTDLHLWRLGPGHFGAIVSIDSPRLRSADFYRSQLARFPSLSHVTIEIQAAGCGHAH